MTPKHNPPLVLIVDDEVPMTIMLERIFAREGYRVEIVHDGLSALDAAQRFLPDLILLDIMMPGISGLDVLRALRERQATASIPTILVTAKAREASDVEQGLNLGADDYLYKPFEPRELLARAESKMKARQLEEKLQRRTQDLQALLRVAEQLNQSLSVNALLDLVLLLSLDLLPGSLAAIYHLNDNNEVVGLHLQPENFAPSSVLDAVPAKFLVRPVPTQWPDSEPLVKGFSSGMIVPLQQGERLLGLLMLVRNEEEFDDYHMQLFEGVGRQAALALRNAELYESVTHQAEHLEEMVAERTLELESAQQMLIRSEKLASIGHLAASIAHEINNPLTPIRIHLADMTEDIQNNHPVDAVAIQHIQDSIERITRIVSQLLEFAGKRNPDADVQYLDVRRTLEGVINLNQKLFEQNGMSIKAKLTTLPPIFGSKDQLEQVFMNMVLNAQAALKRGGKLKILAWAEIDRIMIQFADNGCGIEADRINKIFDPFYSTKPNGTGLGLFVSYGIIQNHQGTIEVESKVNVGTTFTISLPITPNPA